MNQLTFVIIYLAIWLGWTFSVVALPAMAHLEGFDLQELDGQLVAVWAHRGQDEDPGVIYWGLLDLFQKNSALVPWHHFEEYKVEGIELVSGARGGVFVGTDDENKGSRLGKL